MQKAQFAIGLAVLMICTSLSGCLGAEEEQVYEESSPFDFDRPISNTTWYHYSGGVDALNGLRIERPSKTDSKNVT